MLIRRLLAERSGDRRAERRLKVVEFARKLGNKRKSRREWAMKRLLQTNAPAAVVLIRLAVGAIFLSEGIQKFLYPDDIGAGRFAKIGIPNPELMGPFVGVVEIICGALVLLGFLTRVAAVPLIATMIVAIVSTKIPILLGHGFWGFSLRQLPRYGFLSMAHEARTDFAMLTGSLFLLIVGAGRWSLDALVTRRRVKSPKVEP
jgi:putative oxidoreductase